MGEGWREKERPDFREKDSTGKLYKRLWDIDNWLLDHLWDHLPEGSELRLKIGGGLDEALEKASIAERRMRAIGKAIGELGPPQGPEDIDELLKLTEKLEQARKDFHDQLAKGQHYLGEIMLEYFIEFLPGMLKPKKPGEPEAPPAETGPPSIGGLPGEPVPPAEPGGGGGVSTGNLGYRIDREHRLHPLAYPPYCHSRPLPPRL